MRLTFTAIAALCPVAAFATDYLSVEQAQKLVFPEADSFQARDIRLGDAQREALERLSGLPARSLQWQVLCARKGGRDIGYLVVDNVISHAEQICGFRALISADPQVTEAVSPTGAGALLVVREPIPER